MTSTGRHRALRTEIEIERKFDAGDDVEIAGLASIDGVASVADPVAHDLDAEYFDTGDRRLFRAGIVVRRRLGGHDEGWHAKIERADGARIEVHEPVGEPTAVPESLRRLLVLHLHDAELAPVARIRNHRTVRLLLDEHGRPVAEVCDDHVTATTPDGAVTAWRELEVELAGGGAADLELLERVGDQLRRAGAEPSPWSSKLSRALGDPAANDRRPRLGKAATAGDVVTAYLAEQVDTMRRLDPAVRLDASGAVHKMRVAARRLRSTLATYHRLLDSDVTEPIRDELKWLGAVLGAVRDAEVIRRYLDGVLDDQPPALVVGPVRERIDASTNSDHAEAHQRVVDELNSGRYLDLMAAVAGVTGAVQGRRAGQPATIQLPEEVGATHRRMKLRLDRALRDGPPSEDQLHDVRKSIKRARYAAEAVRPAFGERAAKYAARMEMAQELLGDQQDSVVVRAVLLRLAADATAAGESAFTYGRLHALEAARGRERAAQFLDAVEHGWARRPAWLG